jgi:ribosomal protein S12 methylthiotransferase
MSQKISFISLGCSKNLVDSEHMLFFLDEAGFSFTPHADQADAVVVNTCAFIDEAKQEAIDQILEMCALKNDGESNLKAVVVAGCLAQRYQDELYREIPEIDGIVTSSSIKHVVETVKEALEGKRPLYTGDKNAPMEEMGRLTVTPFYTAYVKISEGCNHRCSYCTIPSIRGRMRSRKKEDVLAECKALVESGAKELIIIAQDITRYGADLYGKPELASLIKEICRLPVEWVRLHYMNPDGFTEELIETIANEPKILKYLDIPIQHVSDTVLKRMHRAYTGDTVRSLFTTLRNRIPGVVLRTSLIVGFPGETDEDFEELCAFLKEFQIERAGVFAFSPQEDTKAAALPHQHDEETKIARSERVAAIQQEVMEAFGEGLIGRELVVLCEAYDRLAEVWFGRSFADSPDVDGKVFFTVEGKKPRPGDFVTVLVEELFDGCPIGRAL